MKKEALLYEKLKDNAVRCFLCNHHCSIPDKGLGICGERENISGILYAGSFGRIVASHVDPIEKKPLYHFLPGSMSFSLATQGCNFRCGFCQNWQISQRSPQDSGSDKKTSPREVVAYALKYRCQSISYTYTEPTIFFEYALEIAKLARAEGLYNIFVTNGYMTQEALKMIKPYLDAANVDLKFFSDDKYQKVCGARLEPVLGSIRLMKELGLWVEVTTLVVPEENDSEAELCAIAGFISKLDQDMPWHVSQFHPDYKFSDYPATPESTLKKALRIGKDCGLRYVYAGNVLGWGNDTICPNCKKILIKREVFSILRNEIKKGKCIYCGLTIPGLY